MKLPADGARHYEAGFPQTINKMIAADPGQDYVGLPRKAPASRSPWRKIAGISSSDSSCWGG